MGRELNPFEKELYQRTDEVLHYIWDPIRVAGEPEVRYEYDTYLPRVFSMLFERKKEDEIANYLIEVEDKSMGLTIAPERAALVAAILTDWCEFLREQHKANL